MMFNLLIILALKSTPSFNSLKLNYWMALSIIEFILILFLLFKLLYSNKTTYKNAFKNESVNNEIDFKNIFNSSFHSTEIYDELKVKCHPDRFVHNIHLQRIAENLFQEISKNKNNAKVLLELKNEAIQKLDIKF